MRFISIRAGFFRSLTALLLGLLTEKSNAEPTPQDVARNQINSIVSGDHTTNIIGTGFSRILVFRDGENVVRKEAFALLRELKETNAEFFSTAAEMVPEADARTKEQLVLASYAFQDKQYSLSAALYEEALAAIPREAVGYNAVEGLVNASLFGSGRHVEGLNFICQQYKFRPKWSVRFRHDVHAHLRALATKFDHQYALQVLNTIRGKPACQRLDFSPVWIPIHLSDMRALEDSRLPVLPEIETYRSGFKYGFASAEDEAFAEQIMKDENVQFIDYLYFVSGKYRNIVDGYKESYIYDIALLAEAVNSPHQRMMDLLERYVERYPNTKNFDFAVNLLITKLIEHRELARANRVLDLYGPISLELDGKGSAYTPKQIALAQSYLRACGEFPSLLSNLNFAVVGRALSGFNDSFQSVFGEEYSISLDDDAVNFNSLACSTPHVGSHDIKIVIDVFSEIALGLANFDERVLEKYAVGFKVCGDARVKPSEEPEFGGPVGPVCASMLNALGERVSFHKVASKLAMRIYEIDRDQNSHMLFLSALSDRNNDDYEDYEIKLKLYTSSHAGESFADDAYAELGWFELVIREDPEKAIGFFQTVVNEYSDSNAYDNALNWLVVANRMQGRYSTAVMYAGQLGMNIVSSRLARKIGDRQHRLKQFVGKFDFDGALINVGERVSSYPFWGWGGRSLVVTGSKVKVDEFVITDASIVSVDGNEFDNLASLYEYIAKRGGEGEQWIAVRIALANSADQWNMQISIEAFGYLG